MSGRIDDSKPIEQANEATTRRLTGAERRTEFLNAAASIIMTKGTAAVSMNSVAIRTGVSKRLGYRYFENRNALLKALIDRELAEVGHRARAVLPRDAGLEETLKVNITVWLQRFEERGPLLMRLLFGQDVVSSVVADINARSIKNWAGILGDALPLDPATAEILASLYISALRGAVEALERKLAPLEQIASTYATAALAGAQAVSIQSAMQAHET